MKRRAGWKWVLVLALAGCGGESLESRDGGIDASATPPPDTGTSTPPDGGKVHDGGSCGPVALNQDTAPGQQVGNAQAPGAGDCAGRSLAEVVAAVHAARPDLADVVTLYDPTNLPVGDGSFIYAWQRQDGGFSLAFVRGSGDCPAGCSDHEYFYFETAAGCTPMDLGRYHASYQPLGNGYCIVEEGQPRWGKPPSVTPSSLCEADMTPQDISGKAVVYAKGQRVDCDETTKTMLSDIDGCLQLVIQQDPGNLAVGQVQLLGTGHAAFDAPLPATFERRRFAVNVDEQTPGGCAPSSRTVQLTFDLEAMTGVVNAQDVVPLANCDYCKVNLSLALTLAANQQ